MQLSTNLPHGMRAIAEHVASGQALTMNVSPEADRTFRVELKNKRPSDRWRNLEQAMQRDFYRTQKASA